MKGDSRPAAPLAAPSLDLSEVTLFHAALAVIMTALGYLAWGAISTRLGADLNTETAPIQISAGAGEGWWIFGVNLTFFTIVALLPFINLLLVIPQFLNLGQMASAMGSLSLADQFMLVYRHTIFEIAALIISVRISYLLFSMIRGYGNRALVSGSLSRVARLYLAVIVLTAIGALLEGTSFVHLQ